MAPSALLLALSLTAASTSSAAPAVAPGTAAVRALQTPADVAALCAALQPFERKPWKGDVVSASREEARQAGARTAAMAGAYQVRVPAARLRFAPYDAEEATLELSPRAFLSSADDALWLSPLHIHGLPVAADPGAAERIVRAAERRTLALILAFTLAEDEDDATCGHLAGARQYALGVEPLSWAYVEGETVLARGGEGSDRPLVSAAQGARPRVRVSEVGGDRGPELKRAVEARQADLQDCYERALQKNPGLDGAYVAEVDPGAADRVRLALDAVGDSTLSGCVSDVLAQVASSAGGRAHVPIHFELLPPSSAGEQGTGAAP